MHALIEFEKINSGHLDIIFSWLQEPHLLESWDTSQEHKDDIINFVEGRITPSSYADGQYVYWLAKENGHPFAMIMSIQETADSDINEIKLEHLSKKGHSYGLDFMIGNTNYLDFMIGNTNYLGKGYAARTLSGFMRFFRKEIDPKAKTFLIDPAIDNPKAKHIYMKAGFEYVGDFIMRGEVSGTGRPHHLLIKHIP